MVYDNNPKTRFDFKFDHDRDFYIEVENDIDMTGYNYEGVVVVNDSDVAKASLVIEPDIPNRLLKISLIKELINTLTPGVLHRYDIKEVFPDGRAEQFCWGNVNVYDSVTP